MRYLLIALLLSGCAIKEAQQDMRIARAGAECEKLGYTPETDAFRDCRMKLYSERRASAAQKSSTTCQTAGNTTTCY